MKREVEKKKNGEIKKLKNKNRLSRTFFCNHSMSNKKVAPFMAPLCIFKKKKSEKNKTNSPNYFQIRINRIIQ